MIMHEQMSNNDNNNGAARLCFDSEFSRFSREIPAAMTFREDLRRGKSHTRETIKNASNNL